MAQKGQKFNKYDQDLKNQIIQDFYLSHYSYKLISIKYSIPIGTLATGISHSKRTDYLKDENVSNKTVKTILQLSLNHLRSLKMEQKQLLAENTQLKTNKKINLGLKKQIQKLEAKNQILKKYQTFIRGQQKKK